MIGEQIKKYRTIKGLTQEELGNRVGVTTQAVSKWERGGVPDAESIPLIADALDVSTDMLFGREATKTIIDMIMNEIQSGDRREGFKKTYQYMWAASVAIMNQENVKESLGIEVLDKLNTSDGMSYYSRFSLDEGIMDARLNADFRYLFFMPQPQEGFAGCLGDYCELADTLSVLGDRDVMKILFYMYSRKNTPLSLSLIAAKTQLPVSRTEKAMDKMCSANMTKCSQIETESGFIKAYTFCNETVVLPLLLLTKEMKDEKMVNWGVWYERNDPLF